MEAAWNRSVLRTNNERLLLDLLRAGGATSRAALARTTGLSKPTVSTALNRLSSAGLVRELGKVAAAGRGRSPVLYEAHPGAAFALGVDIGRSWIRVALADLDGLIVGRHDAPNAAQDADGMVAAVAAVARKVAAEAGVAMDSVLHAVVGSPGVVDMDSHSVRYAVNLPGWGEPGVADRLQAELGTGLSLRNDANLAALGEYAAGAGQGRKVFVYVMVGTGVGGGIVIDGELFPGAHGAAGELGYLPWGTPGTPGAPHTPGTPAGGREERRGLLEHAAAADAVVAMARAAGVADVSTAKQVFDAARAGDDLARAVVAEEAKRLAHGIAAVAAVIDPDLVILGGGVGKNADLLLPLTREALATVTPLRIELAASTLGPGAVLHGAVAAAVDVARERVFEAWQNLQETAA